MNETAQQQQQQQEQPSNDEIIRQAKELVIHLYGEEGYTLGDGTVAVKKPRFKTILSLKNNDKPALIREIYRRHDCCARLNIKTARERPKRNLTHESVKKLQTELKLIVPSAVCITGTDKDDLNLKKRQLDAIRAADENHPRWDDTLKGACTAVWHAMQRIKSVQVPVPQDPNPGDTAGKQDDGSSDRSMAARMKNNFDPKSTDGDMSVSFSAMSLADTNNTNVNQSSKPDSDVKQGNTIVVPNMPPTAPVRAGDTPHPSLKTAQNDQSGQQGPPRCVYGALS